MRTSAILATVITAAFAAHTPAQIVDWGVSRGPLWTQTTDDVAPAVPDSWDFEFFVDALNPGDVTGATVKGPGLPPAGIPLVAFDPGQTSWFYLESFADAVAMDTRFPGGGNYTLETTGALGSLSQSFTLPVRNTPAQPVFTGTTLARLQLCDEQVSQLVTWAPPGTVDLVSFALLDLDTFNPAVQFDSFTPVSQYTINAFTLFPDRCYAGGLAFINFTQPAGAAFGLPGSIVDVQATNLNVATFTRFASQQQVVNPGNVNPNVFLPDPNGAVVGGIWQPRVDHTNFAPNAPLDALIISGAPSQTPSPFGVFLVNPGAQLAPLFFRPAGLPFFLPVPNNCAFYGVTVPVQAAAVYANGFFEVTNALYVTPGAF